MMTIMNDQMIFVFLSVRNTSIVLSFADEQRRGCAGGGQRDSHVQVMISQMFPNYLLGAGNLFSGVLQPASFYECYWIKWVGED